MFPNVNTSYRVTGVILSNTLVTGMIELIAVVVVMADSWLVERSTFHGTDVF